MKKKHYNFLDQRKADFDQDYEEFCKEINDLHVGFMNQISIKCSNDSSWKQKYIYLSYHQTNYGNLNLYSKTEKWF